MQTTMQSQTRLGARRGLGQPACFRRQASARPAPRPARLPGVVRAAGGDDKKDGKAEAKQEKLIEGLKRGGMDKDTAQKVLQVWKETGAESPDGLRKMLVGRSLRAAGVVGIQTALDAGASWGAFSAGASLAAGQPFFGKIALEYVCYFLGLYFGTSVLLDLFTLGAIAFSGLQYSTNSEAFLGALRQIAGPKQSGINVVQKAQNAVNTAKVVSALNRISALLKERAGAGDVGDSLSFLSVYLLLQKAEASGFRAADYNLSDEQVSKIAAVFAKYDLNDDMVLSTSEVDRLFQGEGFRLSDAEVRGAIKLLDKNGDGLIQFSEFVDWWQNEVSEEAKAQLEQQQQQQQAASAAGGSREGAQQ